MPHETRVLFSAASIWQIAIKRTLGRLDFAFKPGAMAQAALDTKFDELAVRQTHAARVRHLPPLHADPFDRLLLAQAQAQAQCEGALLVTADQAVIA